MPAVSQANISLILSPIPLLPSSLMTVNAPQAQPLSRQHQSLRLASLKSIRTVTVTIATRILDAIGLPKHLHLALKCPRRFHPAVMTAVEAVIP